MYRIEAEKLRKILVIQFRPFGDVLLATSYLEALQEKFPKASIDFLVKKPFEKVLFKNPWIADIVTIEPHRGLRYLAGRVKLFSDIRSKQYDLVIDQQSGVGSGQVVLFSKATYKLGWSSGRWRWCYNLKAEKGPVRYRSSQNFDMLKPLDISEKPHKPFYHVKTESMDYAEDWLKTHQMDPERTIIISPGSPRRRKKWLLENFAILAENLVQKKRMQVVILWGPQEHQDARVVVALSRQACVLAPPSDYNQAAAFLKRCRLLICNDGGLYHLSVAVDAPALAIFGSTPPAKWSAQGYFPGHYHLYNEKWDPASGNHFGVTPEDAYEKVSSILEEWSSPSMPSNS